MRHLAVLLMPLLFLAGCAGVDKSRVEAQVATLEQRASDLQAFIDRNAPLVIQLRDLAAKTQDPTLMDAAAKVAASVAAAQAALPEVRSAITETKAQVAALEADASGKVPWWSIAGGVLLTWAPRILAVIPGLQPLAALWANLHWQTSATKAQKDEEKPRA